VGGPTPTSSKGTSRIASTGILKSHLILKGNPARLGLKRFILLHTIESKGGVGQRGRVGRKGTAEVGKAGQHVRCVLFGDQEEGKGLEREREERRHTIESPETPGQKRADEKTFGWGRGISKS